MPQPVDLSLQPVEQPVQTRAAVLETGPLAIIGGSGIQAGGGVSTSWR